MMPASNSRAGAGVRPVYIIGPDEAAVPADLGRKAHALAALKTAGFPIPGWFVVSPLAFEASLTDAERMSLAAAARATARFSVLSNLTVAATVLEQLEEALQALCPNGERVAVRSSAADEDEQQRSFAGQFETYLCVPPGQVAQRIVDVWRSGFSDRVLTYRRAHAMPFPTRAPAVIVQRQVDADAAGVAFSADPVSGRRMVAVVAAVLGLGTTLMSGESESDTFHVSRDGRITGRTIGVKQVMHGCATGDIAGVRAVPLPNSEQRSAAIDDRRVCEVAELARRAARHFGMPQDIEWAIERGRLYLLQSRPITALGALADPDGALNIWDNSNVAESYPGITSPLTFSFIRDAYEEVYRELCRLLGVSPRVLAAHDDTFGRMLGLVRGRVYYNLLSWYRLLATLPGFTLNRRFMEQMMGVSDGVPDDAIGPRPAAGVVEKTADAVRVIRTTIGLAWNCVRLPASIGRFRGRLTEALGSSEPSFADARPDEIVAHYRLLERQLLKRWDAPLVNDFFAMIFYGILRRLTERWCGDEHRALQNDLIAGDGGVISTQPAVRVRALAEIAAAAPPLAEVLSTGSPASIAAAMSAAVEFRAAFDSYLAAFGDRSFEELKLESLTLADDPLPVFRLIGQLAKSIQRGEQAALSPATAHASRSAGVRAAAEARVRAALAGKPFRRVVFAWVLGQARARVRDRENLRFERTRLFGRVRRIFRSLGRELVAVGALTDREDVFYLHVDEVLGFVEGTAVSTDLKGLVALRRAEYARYASDPPPDDRFETRGAVHAGNQFRRGGPMAAAAPNDDSRTGLGCCAGIVEAPVVVVRDPRNASPLDGAILVAERTDPAWVVLFSSARGLLIERGSVLSHSAIIAREMGIPTIVSVAGVTGWLRDGDLVRMDGSTGVVRRVSGEAGHAS